MEHASRSLPTMSRISSTVQPVAARRKSNPSNTSRILPSPLVASMARSTAATIISPALCTPSEVTSKFRASITCTFWKLIPSFRPPSFQKLISRSQLTRTTRVSPATSWAYSASLLLLRPDRFNAACTKRRTSQLVVQPNVEVKRVSEVEGGSRYGDSRGGTGRR